MPKKKAPEYRSVLTRSEKETLVSILIRNPDAFKQAKDRLKPEHFGTEAAACAMIWQVVTNYYAEHGKLPKRAALMAGLAKAIDKAPAALTETQQAEAEALVEMAFDDEDAWQEDLSKSEHYARWAIKTLQVFLEEGWLAQVHETAQSQRGIGADIFGLLQTAGQKMDEITAIGAPPVCNFLSEDWDMVGGIGIFTTGIPFFDALLNGGHAPGEVYGLLGPTGSCKTTLAMMLCVEACRQAHAILLATGEHQYVFLVSYEAPLQPELRFRAISYAAQIHRQSLDTMNPALGLKSLSTGKHLKGYEKKMFYHAITDGKEVRGEQGRYNAIRAILDKHLIVLDMTGADFKRHGAGGGYVPEIAAAINAELKMRGPGAKARMVAIDYIGAVAERHMVAKEKDERALRHLIKNAPLLAKNRIATRFSCPVWLLHQLSGKANAGGLTAKRDHTDAAESRSFAENLDFAFVIGPPDSHGLCVLRSTKHRRTGHQKEQIIQIKGELNTVVDVGATYMFDPYTRMIVERDIVQSLAMCVK